MAAQKPRGMLSRRCGLAAVAGKVMDLYILFSADRHLLIQTSGGPKFI